MSVASATLPKSTAVAEIERLGFGWTEEAQYDLTSLSAERRVQVREIAHYAPKETVSQYAVQMAHVQFPPIVVTNDGWVIDGNTRVGAALERGNKFFPAYVLDVAWSARTTTKKQQNELYALAATLNATGGVRLTSKETRNVTARFIALGWKSEQIARAIGIKQAGVTAIKKEVEAEAKLKHVGMDGNGSLRGASLRALGSSTVLDLNDVPFKTLATLAGDAGLNASEIVGAAKDAKSTGSDAAQLELLEKLRTEMAERIKNRTLTGSTRPPVSRQMRQRLGFVTKFVGREQELLETDPSVVPVHIEALEQSIAVLSTVLELQRP